jgi:DNA-binding LacI/PurR family transcriptional regulator
MAATAVSMLVQRPVEGAPLERRLDHALVVRQSTAPPGA